MLDPELLDQLAARPADNNPDVNVALAEQGHASVLLSLLRHHGCGRDTLAVIGARVNQREPSLLAGWEIAPAELWRRFDDAVLLHPASPGPVRDAILERYLLDPSVVLIAATHPHATLRAVTAAADWPARLPLLERLWLTLVPATALPAVTAQAWAKQPRRSRRELVARLTDDAAVLALLAKDPAREVRRAVASNRAAGALREALAQHDPAAEVRVRAASRLGDHPDGGSLRVVDSARFAAALRAMEAGGVLTADVAAALLAADEQLDEEGAMFAARVLPHAGVLQLVASIAPRTSDCAANRGLAAGLCLRAENDGDGVLRDIIADAAQSLSCVVGRYGVLTGKARLAAWFADGLAGGQRSPAQLAVALCDSVAAVGPILKRAFSGAQALSLCRGALKAERLPPSLIDLAWHHHEVSDEEVIALALRMSKAPRRGKDLRDDELDLDPTRRPLATLEQVVLNISRKSPLSPRTALSVVAMDSRRVRYILTALPLWRGRLSGSTLARVLRQHAGALSAARAEARSRGAENKAWTQRMLSDSELAVALAIGHITPDLVSKLLHSGRNKPLDGVGLAHGADTRATLGGKEHLAPLLYWATEMRRKNATAFTLWLLLESHDRARPLGMISSSLDSLAVCGEVGAATVSEALATFERRSPGRLERMTPQTPRGKAALAGGVARAYRALGGLRDER